MTNASNLRWVCRHQDGFDLYQDIFEEEAPLWKVQEGQEPEIWTAASATPYQRLASLRRILERHQYEVIDGCVVDALSARAVLIVFDALNEKNRLEYIQRPVEQMVQLAWKLIA